MSKRGRTARIAAAALVVALLTACDGEVIKKDADRPDGPSLLLLNDGKERWEVVTDEAFKKCDLGEWYDDDDKACSPMTEEQRINNGGGDIRRGQRNIPVDDQGRRQEEPQVDPQEDLVLVTVNLSSTAKGGIMTYHCQGDGREIFETMKSRSFHSRCLLRRGQRVTVSGAARGAGWECNMTILAGGVEVAKEIGMNSVRCTWVAAF